MEKDISLQPKDSIVLNNQKVNTLKSKALLFITNKSNVLMILIVITKLIVISLLYGIYQYKAFAIFDSINIGITIIGFGLYLYNKAFAFWIHWAIYVCYYIIIIVIHFISYCNIEDEQSFAVIHKDIFSNLIFFNIYIQNSFFFLGNYHYKLGKIGNRIHMALWIILTFAMLIITNCLFTFRYETITFSYSFIFGLLCYFWRTNRNHADDKTSDSGCCNANNMTYHRDRRNNSRRATCDSYGIANGYYESIPSFYGSCIVNEQLLIRYQNEYFMCHMKDICITKAIQIANTKESDDIKSITTSTNNNNNGHMHLCSSSRLMSLFSKSNASARKTMPTSELYLNGDNIMLIEEEDKVLSHNKVNLKEAFYFNFIYLLKSSSLEFQSRSQFKDKFIELGEFNYSSQSKERKHYEVYCRIISNANMNNAHNDSESLYELAFYELTDNLKKNKKKIEKKYKNLLLRKINHEFKVPIVLIQNMINEINKVSSSVQVKSISKTIKYVTDTILLLVSDLTEYIHLNTMKVEDKEMKSAFGFVSVNSLFQDIQNICFVYTKVFNKNVSIHFEINDLLKNGKIMINENKIKQILSILITNAIKNSSQISISFDLNEKQERQAPIKFLTSSIKPIDHSAFNVLPVDLYNLSPKADRLKRNPEYEIVITVEDNGPGIDKKIINTINASFNSKCNTNSNNNNISSELSPIKSFNSYKNRKGLGTGLMIGIKLCKDLNIALNCDIIGFDFKPQGTKFTLSIHTDITFEDVKNDSCIIEYQTESSNSSISINESEMTNEVYIENFHIGIENGNESVSSLHHKSKSSVAAKSRKSLTSLFYKPRYGYNIGEIVCISPVQVANFTINAAVIHSKGLKNNSLTTQKYADIPLFNDSDMDYSLNSNDRYVSFNQEHKKKLLLTPEIRYKDRDSHNHNAHFNSNDKLDKLSTFNLTNLMKLKGIKSKMRSGSTQRISSLFNKESMALRSVSRVKDLDSNTNNNNNNISNLSLLEDKSAIVIVDDIDSNKKAIYSLVCKQLSLKDKKDLYEFELLSDGIELINLFYKYQSSNKKIKIIICDESMNYLNGSEAFAIINKVSITKSIQAIPFILCSAFSDNGFKEQMVSIGIKNLYEKPLQSSNIERIIQEFEL